MTVAATGVVVANVVAIVGVATAAAAAALSSCQPRPVSVGLEWQNRRLLD